MDLRLEDAQSGGATVVAVAGELDALSAPQLDEHLTEVLNDSPKRLVVDLTEVDFLDSTGLGVLIKTLTHLRENDGDLALVATSPRILKVLSITGMDQIMTVGDSVAAVSPGVA